MANPIAAGAGKSYTDHLPNVTGVAVLGPVSDMLDLLEKYYPTYKHLGTLFCPAETNSVDLKDSFAKLCQERGFTLDAVAANSPGEMADASMSLMARPIDAVVQISDNLSSAGFTAIAKAARQTHKPLISYEQHDRCRMGAADRDGRSDYHHAGEVTVELIERVMAGENPANMPFILPPNVVLTVSPANAEAVGMKIPEELLLKRKPTKSHPDGNHPETNPAKCSLITPEWPARCELGVAHVESALTAAVRSGNHRIDLDMSGGELCELSAGCASCSRPISNFARDQGIVHRRSILLAATRSFRTGVGGAGRDYFRRCGGDRRRRSRPERKRPHGNFRACPLRKV